MKSKLADIATISSGIYPKVEPNGEVYLLVGSDFDRYGNGIPIRNRTAEVRITAKNQKHQLFEDDILLVSKGSYNRACRYDHNMGPAMASTLFLVIRVDEEEVLYPRYLQWWLNSTQIQQQLKRYSRGSKIPSISKKMISGLELPLPSLQKQKLIVEIDECAKLENRLRLELAGQRKLLIENRLYEKTYENRRNEKR